MNIFLLFHKLLHESQGLLMLSEFFLVENMLVAVIHLNYSMTLELQQVIHFARVAEQTERYEDMVRYVREIIRLTKNEKMAMQEQEIKLFSNAYKCKINSRRTAWRALEILHSKEVNTKNRSSAIIQFYKENIEKQIREICQ